MPAPRYGRTHQNLRSQLLAVLKPGTPCPQTVNGKVCGQPMWPGLQPLDLGHDDQGGYIGITHAACNRRAGAISGNRLRGRTCRKCRRKFTPTRRRQALCGDCRGVVSGKVATVSAGRAW